MQKIAVHGCYMLGIVWCKVGHLLCRGKIGLKPCSRLAVDTTVSKS